MQDTSAYGEVKASLLYLKSLGLSGVECTDEALALLKSMGKKPMGSPARSVSSRPSYTSRVPEKEAPAPKVHAAPVSESPKPELQAPPVAAKSNSRVVTGPIEDTLESIMADMGECTRCRHFRGRSRIVFGEGPSKARLMIIGDMPQGIEDSEGKPFLGEGGELLNKMLSAMGITRDEVYLANLLKCTPAPGSEKSDFTTCLSFLERQIAVVRPEVIVAMGALAAQILLGITTGVAGIRGQFQNYRGIRLMPTFHPTFLLRHPERKRESWQDLQQVMQALRLNRQGHR